MKIPLLITATALLGLVPHCLANNLVANPGFEKLKSDWKTFEPEEEMMEWGIDDSDPHSGGASAIIQSTSPARRALIHESAFGVYAGKRYRIEAWVKFSPNSTVAPGLPGFYMSTTFSDSSWESLSKNPPYNRIFFGLPNGVVDWEGRKLLQPEKLPEQWTQISAVVEAPPDSKRMQLALTVHGFEGDLFLDDISVEKVDESTPVTESLR